VWLEYGLQTMHDRTLRAINRGHNFAAFCDAVSRTQGRGIFVCAHVILGLQRETWRDMMQTAETVAQLAIDGIKLHHLHIVSGTPMATDYAEGRISVMGLEEYVSLAADFLERLPPDMVIQRLVGDAPSDMLIAPKWGKHKNEIVRAITEELKRRGTCQGYAWSLGQRGIQQTRRSIDGVQS